MLNGLEAYLDNERLRKEESSPINQAMIERNDRVIKYELEQQKIINQAKDKMHMNFDANYIKAFANGIWIVNSDYIQGFLSDTFDSYDYARVPKTIYIPSDKLAITAGLDKGFKIIERVKIKGDYGTNESFAMLRDIGIEIKVNDETTLFLDKWFLEEKEAVDYVDKLLKKKGD